MPEGDTILRAARAMDARLAGKRVTSFRSPLPRLARADVAGHRVEAVEALGKNLLVRFDDGRTLRSHMRMTGSWHLYRPGERWRKPERLARAVIATEDAVAVCFNAPVVEMLSARDVEPSVRGLIVRHEPLARLGPDVLAPEFDSAEAIRRLRARKDTPIGEALLDQSALAGIGNIYKSETLFRRRADPFAPVAAYSDEELEAIVAAARVLMKMGSDPFSPSRGERRVYRQSGRPCRRCGTAIRMRRQGDAGRSTYWCPSCQPART